MPTPHAQETSRSGIVGSLRQRLGRSTTSSDTWIDAVSDLTFSIESGEAVGLIGRNGAGKSTLLKLLSRVTRPTAGRADVYGRVGALLEVGTGFHPELTGRENTYLSGAILGMSKRDIGSRFDEIVAFADVAAFIDMPVKRYSSGMYARLGFAVAAFLKPDILIVDEILSVGDLGFQAKCLAHMRQLSTDGATVLFVSHNLLAVADLCGRALLMTNGRLAFDGPVNEAVTQYRRGLAVAEHDGPGRASPAHIRMTVNGERVGETIESDPNQPFRVDLSIDRPSATKAMHVTLNLVIETPDGRMAIHLRSDLSGATLRLQPGRNILSAVIDELPLAPGNYWLWLRVVGLDPREPVMMDTEHVLLFVSGDQATASIASPRHRFEQAAGTLAEGESPEREQGS